MRLRRFLLPAGLGVAAYFALFGGEHNALESWRLEERREREASALDSLRFEVERLGAWADSLESDSATLERVARERFGMIRDGERLYRFAGEGEPDSTSADTLPERAPRR